MSNTRRPRWAPDPSLPRVRTAWSDPEHVRLTRPAPDELLASHETERLRKADPDDPWATAGTGGDGDA